MGRAGRRRRRQAGLGEEAVLLAGVARRGTTRRRSPTRARRRATAAPRGRCSRPPGCSTGSGGRRGRTRPAATAAPGCGTAPARSGRAGSPTARARAARSEWSSAPLRATISAFSFSTSTTARRIGHDAERLEAGVEQQRSPQASGLLGSGRLGSLGRCPAALRGAPVCDARCAACCPAPLEVGDEVAGRRARPSAPYWVSSRNRR